MRSKLYYTLLLATGFLLFSSGTCNQGVCKENRKPDCMCTMQYDPVCGCNGKTYGNACEAECAGIRVVHKGECKGDKK